MDKSRAQSQEEWRQRPKQSASIAKKLNQIIRVLYWAIDWVRWNLKGLRDLDLLFCSRRILRKPYSVFALCNAKSLPFCIQKKFSASLNQRLAALHYLMMHTHGIDEELVADPKESRQQWWDFSILTCTILFWFCQNKNQNNFFVLTGQNTIAKQKKVLFWFWFCPKTKQNTKSCRSVSISVW